MTTFKPRKEAPTGKELWWSTKYSIFPTGSTDVSKELKVTIPSASGYAYGRFAEILQDKVMGKPKIQRKQPGEWYDFNRRKQIYEYGDKPKLGAIIVFKKKNAAGHVGIVEEILPDGSIYTSESSNNRTWKKRFSLVKRTPPKYTTNDKLTFCGFIYNPAVDDTATGLLDINNPNHPAQICIRTLQEHTGLEGHTWVMQVTGIGAGTAWCAATMCAMAKVTGYGGIIFPDSDWTAAGFGRYTVETYGGEYIAGPRINGGQAVTPQPGDIICFGMQGGKSYQVDAWIDTSFGKANYASGHVGMVAEVTDTSVITIERRHDEIGSRTLAKNDTYISYYARPDWTKVGGSALTNGLNMGGVGGSLYATQSTREDATMREVCYLDKLAQPSIKATGIKLSVVNYTSLLNKAVGGAGGVSTSAGGTGSIEGLDPVPRTIVEFLQGKGLNIAACLAVLVNIEAESSFQTNAVNKSNGASGLCQWLGSRKTNMIAHVGSDWANNLSGQLEFLWFELSDPGYATLMSALTECPNTLEGAKNAADKFIRLFERPESVSYYSQLRQKNLEDNYWPKVVMTSTTVATGAGTAGIAQGIITTQSGRRITEGTAYNIPAAVEQSGIVANLTGYDGTWNSTSRQYIIHKEWVAEGKPSSYGVATVKGYYLIAISQYFGTTGDIVQVQLANGQRFNAILGDAKDPSDSNYTQYGHRLGTNQIDIIEWEAACARSAAIEFKPTLSDGLKSAGWLGVNVSCITNFGTWLDG